MTRYQIDSSWWRRANTDGDTVVAGSPLKIFRFSSAARSVLEAIEKRDEISVAATNTLHRLIDAGAIHPILESIKTSLQPSDVTVVIPVHNEDVLRLNALISKLSAAHEVLLIDDGSTIPLADINGARVIRREVAGGPAAARNTAIDFVTTSITFFLDADTSLTDDSWTKLLAHFEDSSVGVIAPRIASEPGTTLLHRYEASESPLDLGSEPARIRKNSRVSYVPTAALMIRTDLLREHRGFDESLRYGEDVDLVWRLLEADIVCRYEPAVTVHHSPRATLLDAWKQRVSYGIALICAPYPMIDDRNQTPATYEITDLGVWDRKANIQSWGWYLGQQPFSEASPEFSQVSIYAAPARAENLTGLAPIYTDVGDVDLFRDDVIDFVKRLQAAGNKVEFYLIPGMFHAGELFNPDARISKTVWQRRFDAIIGAFNRG